LDVGASTGGFYRNIVEIRGQTGHSGRDRHRPNGP
jgi:hypothetical protein